MTTATARYKREVALEQASLRDNLHTLEDKARRLADWRRPVRERPMEAASAALAAGLLLGLLAGPRAARDAETGERLPAKLRAGHPLVDRFVATFATIAAERAIDALSAMLPRTSHDSTHEPATPNAKGSTP